MYLKACYISTSKENDFQRDSTIFSYTLSPNIYVSVTREAACLFNHLSFFTDQEKEVTLADLIAASV